MIAGCSSPEEALPSADGNGESTDTSQTDGSDAGASGGESTNPPGGTGGLPPSAVDDFPVEIPGGWETDILGELGLTNTTGVQLLYPAGDFANIVAFYDDWTESQTGEILRTEVGDMVVYTGVETDSGLHSIAITRDHQERDQSWVLLQVTGDGSQ